MTEQERKQIEEICEYADHKKWCIDPMKDRQQIITTIEDLKRSNEYILFLLSIVDSLTAALAKEEKRAEAAIKMLKQSNPCNHCTHFADGKYCNYCDDQCCNFKWRDPTEQEESE